MSFQTLVNQIKKKFDRVQPAIADKRQSGVAGDGSGHVVVDNLPGYTWVRIGSAPAVPVLNKRITAANGMPVYVGYDPIEAHLYQVLGSAVGTNEMPSMNNGDGNGIGIVGPHGSTHAFLGGDPTFIDKRQILPGRIGPAVPGTYVVSGSAQAMLEIWADVIYTGSAFLILPHQLVDLTSLIPATAGYSCYVCISVDTSTVVNATAGTAVPLETPDLSLLPAVPTGQFLLGYVRLRNGMTEIADGESTDILDTRSMIPVIGSGGSGTGDVVGPGSAVDGNMAVFDTTTGKKIKDGGAPLALGTATPQALGTAAAGAATAASHENHVHPTGNLVYGPSGAPTDGHVALFDGTTGKLIKDGGSAGSGNVSRAASPATTGGHMAVWAGPDSYSVVDGGPPVQLSNADPEQPVYLQDPGTGTAASRDDHVHPTGQIVFGPASPTNGHVALFDGTTGRLIKDGGLAGTGTVQDTGSTTANHLATWNGASDHTLKDGGAPLALGTATPQADGTAAAGNAAAASHENHIHPVGNTVFGPSSAPTDGHVALFDGVSGKLLKDGGAPTGTGNVSDSGATSPGHLALWNGTNDHIVVDGGPVPTGASSPVVNAAALISAYNSMR